MTAVVDRIEENLVVCETPDEQRFSIPLDIMPDAREGYSFSVGISPDGGYLVTGTDREWFFITVKGRDIKLPICLCPTAQVRRTVTFTHQPGDEQQRHHRIADLMDELFE